MSLPEFFLLLMAVSLSAFGQVYLKTGALKLGEVSFSSLVNHLARMITIPELFIGLTFYGLGAIAYILVLTRVKLSVAGPAASVIYILTVWLGYLFFNEPITVQKAFGVGLIVCGVAMIGLNS